MSFRILKRIELTVTCRSGARTRKLGRFRILKRIELTVTHEGEDLKFALEMFPYPQTDRIDCDPLAYSLTRSFVVRFRILKRIELTVTF